MPHLTVDGIELYVHDAGRGAPLALLHGFPLSHKMWRGQLEPLARTRRVIAPDFRGFGASDVVPGTGSMEQFADDLLGTLDALGVAEPVHLCGLSMGGYAIWPFLRKHPQRVRSLILCDTRSAADSDEARAGRFKLAEAVLRDGPDAAFQAMRPKLFSERTRTTQPETVDFLREIVLGTSREGIAAALQGMAERPDSTPLLAGIRVPTLIVVGAEDVITPVAEMERLAAAIPGAETCVVPGVGHMAPLEDPATVNAAIERFLARVEGR